ncbi:MAG: family 20 glycosylhydrolase [Alteromonadales bacterium]|nr:family 20 glycosylhydrolase [Alteromonadales bacterium]
MKKIIFLLIISVATTCFYIGAVPIQTSKLPLVPLPLEVNSTQLYFPIAKEIQLEADNNTKWSKQAAIRLLQDLGVGSENGAVKLQLKLSTSSEFAVAGYRLSIDKNILIEANSDKGLFYGVQTLKQIFNYALQSKLGLPKLVINDQPRYEWRGSMIDVARHFRSMEYLKAHIERMAHYKLNKLHLHLSDDQGWRMEIKAYPKLTEIGASTAVFGDPGGFYSQAELKELVAFATQRFVEIVPEIEMPGHVQAVLASYPELACDGDNTTMQTSFATGYSALCSEKSNLVDQFVSKVLTEVAEVFPSSVLHIGGEEVDVANYAEFIQKVDRVLADNGKTLMGWEEVAEAKTREGSYLQFWQKKAPIDQASLAGKKIVLSPCLYTYLDHGNYPDQSETLNWCRSSGVPLKQVYSFSPADYEGNVVGIEAPLWSEWVRSDAMADNRLWPRLMAVAELAWTAETLKIYQQFTHRAMAHRAQLDRFSIHYYPEKDLNWDHND